MLFAKGSRVVLRHSAEQGVVTDILDKDLLMVRLDGQDIEIPVFTEDLERPQDQHTSSVKARYIQTPPAPPALQPDLPAAESQYAILKSVGIQLAFDPRQDGKAFSLFLLNDTDFELVFHLSQEKTGRPARTCHGKLPAVHALPVGEMSIDELNDLPVLLLRCARITTAGLGPELNKELKIKPKIFFSKLTTAPILNRPVHLFRLIERKELQQAPTPPPPATEDLKTYTLRKARPASRHTSPRASYKHEVQELANFSHEIDLHAENLQGYHSRMTNGEIIRLQLGYFERFIEKAIQVGAERVFVIHGVGKGKLRDAIASRLLQMDEVKTFHNNFHPRYGFGATEVVFR